MRLTYLILVSIAALTQIDITLAQPMSLTEKENLANQFMELIKDYIAELEDKGHPDRIAHDYYDQAYAAYTKKDLENLEILTKKIEERKIKVLKIVKIEGEVKKNIETFKTEGIDISNITKKTDRFPILTLQKDYDGIYPICLDAESELELIAFDYVIKSEDMVNELKENNFNVTSLQDLLLSSKNAFSPANSKELRRRYWNEFDQNKKERFDKLVNETEKMNRKPESVDFHTIFKNKKDIEYTSNQIINIRKRIQELTTKIQNYSIIGVNTSDSEKTFSQALELFANEDFNKADFLIVDSETKLESTKAKMTLTSLIARESMGFLNRNWKTITITFTLIMIGGYVYYRKERIIRLKNRFKNLKAEEEVIINMIKEAQKERFVTKTISDSLYTTKIEGYNERFNKVKEEYKTVKSMLTKLTKNKKKKAVKK